MTLTHQQMLAHWRRARGVEDSREGCSIEVYEGVNTALRHATDMRMWYLNLLDNAPLRYLVTHDVAGQAGIMEVAPGIWQITLPTAVRRVVSVTTADSAGPIAVQDRNFPTNPFLRGSQLFPVVVRDGRNLQMHSVETPVLRQLIAITDPGDEVYELDESALSLLPGPECDEL